MKQPTIRQFCETAGITEKQFRGKEPISGPFEIRNVDRIPNGFKAVIKGDLYIYNVRSIDKAFAPVIHGSFFAPHLVSVTSSFTPYINEHAKFPSLIKVPKKFRLKVGKTLVLDSLETLPPSFQVTVGDDLSLPKVTDVPPDFSPRVGNTLHMPLAKTRPDKALAARVLRLEEHVAPLGILLHEGKTYLNSRHGMAEIMETLSPATETRVLLYKVKTLVRGYVRYAACDTAYNACFHHDKDRAAFMLQQVSSVC